MRRNKFTILIFSVIFFIIILQNVQSQDKNEPKFHWPVIKGNLPDLRGLTSTFAETRYDHFHNGVDISSLNDPIYPVGRGKILYSREKSDDPYKPQIGPGNQIFIDHGNGWWSGYYHLNNLAALREGSVGEKDIIGYTGNTGHSSGAHLHFFITKNYGKVYINPLHYLPAVTDVNPPIIGQIQIITPNGKTLISHSRPQEIRLTKSYPFLIKIIDPGMERNTRRGIFRLEWQLNQNTKEVMNFNELLISEKGWILTSGNTFEETYYKDLYILGDLPVVNGTNQLIVTAFDFAGLSTTVTYSINVVKEF